MGDEQLRFLESLTPDQALRYKCFSTARIHVKVVENVRIPTYRFQLKAKVHN
jgi:hypothetical protein